jgi:ribosome-dependent ATPase
LPQGLGKNLYPTLSDFRERRLLRPALRAIPPKKREWRIDDLFASTDLTSFARSPGRQAVRRHETKTRSVLLADPRSDLLILDEPTTGVDPLARRQFWELIERIRGRRPEMSVLVATATWMKPSGSSGWSP